MLRDGDEGVDDARERRRVMALLMRLIYFDCDVLALGSLHGVCDLP